MLSQLPRERLTKRIFRRLMHADGFVGSLAVRAFHMMYYHGQGWERNTFLGHPIWQFPGDLLLYQEIIFKHRPAFIVQTGILYGGSLLYFATLLDLIQAPADALVIGVDIQLTDSAKRLNHPRIRMIEGSSVSDETIATISGMLLSDRRGMVVLDSDHSRLHVERELDCYADFVAPGQYLVVEDTNVNGHPVNPYHGPGPHEAVEAFLKRDDRFVRDDLWKRNLFSFHQGGWLRRRA